MTLLQAEGISHSYFSSDRQFPVLKEVHFSLQECEAVFISGISGSGKTSLLHILSAIMKPLGGKLFFQGEDVFSLSHSRVSQLRKNFMGYIFQEPCFFSELSLLENVTLPLRLSGNLKGDLQNLAKEMLIDIGLGKRLEAMPRQLSVGQRQRGAIIRSLLLSPAVIFADEPTGNLDDENASFVMNLLFQEAKKKNIALVIVSHNSRFFSRSDRVLSLCDGKLEANQ